VPISASASHGGTGRLSLESVSLRLPHWQPDSECQPVSCWTSRVITAPARARAALPCSATHWQWQARRPGHRGWQHSLPGKLVTISTKTTTASSSRPGRATVVTVCTVAAISNRAALSATVPVASRSLSSKVDSEAAEAPMRRPSRPASGVLVVALPLPVSHSVRLGFEVTVTPV
jgi:hypothetical protein